MRDEDFPVDVAAVNKGDVFGAGWLAAVLPGAPGTTLHQRHVAAFQRRLERLLHLAGKPYTVRYHKGAVEVLSDADAAAHNRLRYGQYTRKAARRHRCNRAVDVALLTDAERQAHERAVATQGRELAALLHARRHPEPQPHARRFPVPAAWED